MRAVAAPLFAYLNTSKRSVVVDDPDLLGAWPDIIVMGPDSSRRDGTATALGHEAERLRAARPELVVVTVTPFGCDGPWAEHPANEFTVQGWAGSSGRRGEPAREPLAAGGRLGEWAAGATGAVAGLAALFTARAGGGGDHIDVSMFEVAITIFNGFMMLQAELAGRASMPDIARYSEVPSVERAADGWVGFATNSAPQFRAFAAMVGHPEWADDPELSRADRRGWHVDDLRPPISAWTSARPVREILDRADADNVPAAPVGNGAVLPTFDHLRARDTWVDNPGGAFVQPRPPYRIDDSPPRRLTPAPPLGADTSDVMAEPPRASMPPDDRARARPLAGLRVFDLTTYWAGPYASQILGWLGADVIKVESVQRPDGTRLGTAYATAGREPWELAPLFHGANTGKRAVTIDMTRDEGRALGRRLLEHCDVFVENFTPKVVDRFGLLDDAHRRNPRLVVARMPAWGLSGPWRERGGFAQNMEQVTGLAWVTGYRDGPPVVPRGPCDPIGGLHAAFVILAALHARERTQQGCVIEAALVDAAVNVAAEQVVDWSARGYLWERQGNRGPLGAPQGVYATRERDRWIALSVETNEQWRALGKVLGRASAAWRDDARWQDDAGRRAHPDELDDVLARAFGGHDLETVVGKLLAAGTPAAEVVRPEDVANPQLQARGYFETLRHPVAGKVAYPGFGARSAARVARKEKLHASPPPLLGQHNREVFVDLLGVSDHELAALEHAAVIGTRPIGR
jgi:crotonobetainyl-CoA:carnitine CoA-transferase CaiB-like acyl-CoA transferase